MATDGDAADAIYTQLSALTARRLTNKEIWEAFGLSKAQFYEARKNGTLTQRVDRLVAAAHRLEINPVELLIALVPGVDAADAVAFVEKRRHEVVEFLEAHRTASGLQINDVDNFIRDVTSPGGDHRLKKGGQGA